MTAFLADEEESGEGVSCQLCADAAQAQVVALMAWNKASKGKGKGKGKQRPYVSKGKGRSKGGKGKGN